MSLAKLLLTPLISIGVAQSSTIVFTDRAAWESAAGSIAFDDFSGAPVGGPFPKYDSPIGVTLRRSLTAENNGNMRTRSTDYNGDVRIDGPPYFFESSSNRVFIFPGGPAANVFSGPEDNYSRTVGEEKLTVTRFPDMATRTVATTWIDLINRAQASVTGSFTSNVFGLGFSLVGGSGPFPGTLVLETDGAVSEAPMLSPAFPFFFGVLSTEPFNDFGFSVRRGTTVHSSENFTNRPCFAPPTPDAPFPPPFEVCLSSGELERWISGASVSIAELLVARSLDSGPLPVSTPEPASALLVAIAVAAGVVKRRLR
jgi:hypothetical protein